MNITVLNNYLIIVNLVGLVLYIINMLLYRYTEKAQIDVLITITSLIGGSIGILIPVLIFQRKINKENEETILSTVFIYCITAIQSIIYFNSKRSIVRSTK